MAHQTSRREFLAGAAASLLPVSKALAGPPPIVTTALGYAATGNILLAVASVIEMGVDYAMDLKQQPELSGIANSMTTIAQKQDVILGELAHQRIVMREEVKQGFLNNDVRELLAISTHFKVALVSDGGVRSSAVQDISGRTIELATKLSSYGLAAVPAYLDAVALQNSVHHVAGSPPQVFIEMNDGHKKALSDMLYGTGPESLNQLRIMLAKSDVRPTSKLLEVGKYYPIWGAIKSEKAGDSTKIAYNGTAYGVIYRGFKNGQVQLQPYNQPLTVTQDEVNQLVSEYQNVDSWAAAKFLPHVNQRFSGDSNVISELAPTNTDAYTVFALKQSGQFDLDADAQRVVDTQRDAIRNYYSRMYSPEMGDINADTVRQRPVPSNAVADNMGRLLANGLDGVNRIVQKKMQVAGLYTPPFVPAHIPGYAPASEQLTVRFDNAPPRPGDGGVLLPLQFQKN